MNPCFPLYCAAPISWYAGIIGSGRICLANEDSFSGHPCMNRIAFTGKQGKQSFSIPLVHKSRHGAYSQVEISYRTNWHRQLVNALRTCYGKSPFFEYFDYRLEPIILKEHRYLWDLNYAILEETLKCIKMPVVLDIVASSGASIQGLDSGFEKTYYQVFAEDTGFVPNLSILDLLFNEGTDAMAVLTEG